MPVWSADAERGFAIMNNVKTTKRSSLNHENLESIMRIKINGPDIEHFDAKRYAAYWVQQHGFRSDDPTNRGKQVAKDDSKKYLDSSYLF